MRPRLLFYVQHLLGIGHLRRAATLARACVAAGLEVRVVSGGHDIPGLDLGGATLVQLPATRATDLYFKVLVDDQGRLIDERWKENRQQRLLAEWRGFAPHLLLFELFPFGRRQMRFELMPLIEAAAGASQRPCIVCSVRDILVGQHKPKRNAEMLEIVERYFDHVLVHGDPTLVRFDETFPHAARIADRITYTGYVVDRLGGDAAAHGPGWQEVIVSAGGGAVGLELLRTALAARALCAARAATWRVMVGVSVAPAEVADLAARAPAGTIIEPARPDFPALLKRAWLSISQGGYNTVMEVLDAGVRAVIVPYAGGIETEQTLRARRLAARGAIEVVDEATLSPATLAAAIDRALAGPAPSNAGIDTGGAERSAALVAGWAAERT
ncbi:MAG: glycosyl transferase family 28 [Alphaproteobacteria bacterium]|nr:glycosyl transferase family 28 [Alphaproteobacteria bacterium]